MQLNIGFDDIVMVYLFVYGLPILLVALAIVTLAYIKGSKLSQWYYFIPAGLIIFAILIAAGYWN